MSYEKEFFGWVELGFANINPRHIEVFACRYCEQQYYDAVDFLNHTREKHRAVLISPILCGCGANFEIYDGKRALTKCPKCTKEEK